LAYFAVAGLDVFDQLDRLPNTKQALIDWIYMHQITEQISGYKNRLFLKSIQAYLNIFLFKRRW
jgi:hypothetical protein